MSIATAQSFDPVERQTYIGASEISAVMGLDRWKTPLDLFNEKRGLSRPFEGNAHTARGNRLEAIAAEYYTEQTGYQLRRCRTEFTHLGIIRGHVDRVVVGEKRLVEIKCPANAAFRKLQREGLPESYIIQAQVYMFLAKMPKLTFVIFCADLWDAAIFDLDYDETIACTAINAAINFWNDHIETGTPPEQPSGDSGQLEIAKFGGSVTVRDDDTFTAKAQALSEAINLKRDAEELFEIAKKDILDAVEGECGIYEGGGLRIYYTESPGRQTLDKKAVAAAGIDLSPFEKQGNPFKTFKTYQITGEQN